MFSKVNFPKEYLDEKAESGKAVASQNIRTSSTKSRNCRHYLTGGYIEQQLPIFY